MRIVKTKQKSKNEIRAIIGKSLRSELTKNKRMAKVSIV
jgi:hypothetical protein